MIRERKNLKAKTLKSAGEVQFIEVGEPSSRVTGVTGGADSLDHLMDGLTTTDLQEYGQVGDGDRRRQQQGTDGGEPFGQRNRRAFHASPDARACLGTAPTALPAQSGRDKATFGDRATCAATA